MLAKTLLVIFISIFAIGIVLNFTIGGLCRTGYSSNKIFSPDGKYFAQIKEESCGGATGDTTTAVTISNAKSIFSNYNAPLAEIINAQTGNKKGILGINGTLSLIRVSWTNNSTLKVVYADCEEPYGQINSWKDIKIIYDKQCHNN
jgi:hypothetical protein